MRLFARITLLVSVALTLAACSHGGSGTKSDPRRRTDLITAADMTRSHWPNAYELVRELRPNWLNNRGPDTISGNPTQVQVVLDGMRYGDVIRLRDLPVANIEYLQYFDPIEASGRWGLGFGAGAIYVASRR